MYQNRSKISLAFGKNSDITDAMYVGERRDLISSYVNQNLSRLDGTPLNIQAGGLGDAWSMLKIFGVKENYPYEQVRKGFNKLMREQAVDSGFAQFTLEGLMEDFAYCSGTTGQHQFSHLREVARRIPDLVFSTLGLDNYEITTGAQVLTSAVVDVSGAGLLTEGPALGQLIREHHLAASGADKIRTKHVIPASAKWLEARRT